MVFNAGRVEVSLGAQLDRRDFELYEKKLKEVRTQVAKKEQFQAQLGGDFNPRAFNAYQRELKRNERAEADSIRSQGRLRTSFGNIYGRGGTLFAAAGGVAALTVGLKSVVQASGEAEVSQKKMAAALKAVGISYEAHAKQIDAVIQRTSKLAGLDDEDLQDAFTAIVRSTKSVNTGLKDMALVADLARAKHMDVAAAGQLVARVHAGNVRVLKSLGIEFVASTKHVDELKESTKKYTPEQLAAAKAQDKHADSARALGLLQDRLKGSAEAYGKTQQGSLDRVNVAFENLRETIGTRLGPSITRAANALAKFIDQMGSGTGAGGKFVDVLKDLVHYWNLQIRGIRQVTDLILSFFTTILDGIKTLADLGSHLPVVGKKFQDLADRTDRAADRLNNLRKEIRPTGHAFDDLGSDVDHMNARLGDSRGFKRFGGNLTQIRKLARTNVTGAVSDVQQGLGQIRAALSQNLKDLGVSGDLKSIGGKSGEIARGLNRAGGGWIGQRGMMGQDVVPAMLAPGEAVLNRHQQKIIETLLGDGFLDQLFARVNTPHYFARGGVAINPAVSTLAGRLNSMFGLTTTSTTGGGHVPGSYHYQGLAADVAGPASSMYRASEWIKSSGTYRSLLEGIHNPNLAVDNGRIYSGAGPFGGVWANHANHIHIALRSLGAAAAGGGVAGIQIPKLVGGRGALGAIAQAALQRGGRAANSALERLVGSLGGGDTSSAGVKGGYNKQQLAGLWRRAGGDPARANLMAAIALAESGGDPRAHNPSGASGLWQILGLPFKGNVYNPLTNAKMAVAKYDSQGLGAWEAYTNGSYRQYLARGGRVSRRKSPKIGGVGGARAYIRPLRTLQTDRIGSYDAVIGAVDDLNTEYGIRERTYDLTDEELIRDDGSVDDKAVARRAEELAGLASVRARIVEQIRYAISVVRKIIHTYNTIIKRLRSSLKHTKGKDRAGVKELISTYQGRLAEWKGTLKDLTGDKLPNASLDYRELLKERREVLGTQATSDAGGDTGSDFGDTGGDTSGGGDTGATDTSPDLQAIADQANARAADLAAQLKASTNILSVFTGSGDIGIGGSSAYGAVRNANAAVGGIGANPAGIAGVGAGGGVTIVQNISSNYPPTPSMLRAIADDAVSGITLQPGRSASTANLGL